MNNIITNLHAVLDTIWLASDVIEISVKDVVRSYIDSDMYLDQVYVELICIDDIVNFITENYTIEKEYAIRAVKIATEYMLTIGTTEDSYLRLELYTIIDITPEIVDTIIDAVSTKLNTFPFRGKYRLPVLWKWNCLIVLIHVPRKRYIKGEYALQYWE